ncbi:hypothetical protein [Nocardioides sp. T2.26MG-1]|uniref:hypothetical protein n=1 Tax=Nocardioides sp. T2.26MG-1 TaxID=3041166 RepID=UPI00254189A9|nr:hypothetical protein [Nocardioides sp. T2.26MG-1]
MDGPLKSNPSGGAGFIEATAGKAFTSKALAIPLEVAGEEPIIVDDVRFLPFKGVPMPRLLKARIEGADAVGQRVVPATEKPAPDLDLTVATRRPIAFNRLVQVRYHLPDSAPVYVALFDIQWVMCLKGRVTERQCDTAYKAALADPTANSAE